MQCKDLSNEAFLNAVLYVTQLRGTLWATRWEVTAVLAGRPELVAPHGASLSVDYDTLIPQKLITAKARKLIRRGVLSGCYCGCRGDYQLTDKYIYRNIVYSRI